jgi:hypothetical protein
VALEVMAVMVVRRVTPEQKRVAEAGAVQQGLGETGFLAAALAVMVSAEMAVAAPHTTQVLAPLLMEGEEVAVLRT